MPAALRLPLDQWPPADRSAWERATTPVDYFDALAPAARWSAKTRYQAQAAYGRWLAFLCAHFPDALALPPAERVDRERAIIYVDALTTRIASMSVAAELGHLILTLGVLAPSADWGWLRKWQYRFQKQAIARDKRGRMVHPVRLIELGIALMDGAAELVYPREQARQFRDGLMIALLAYRPLRRRSLSELKIGTHVRGVGTRYILAVPGIDTKSGHPIEFPLPDRLTLYLTRYLEHYRPLFPNAGVQEPLWLSTKGGALGAEAIYAAICRRTEAAFGRAIYPHLFRDIAVTTIARETPEALDVSRDLLTHANIDTTLRHYSQAKTIDAARTHTRLLDALRSSSRDHPSPARRPDAAANEENRIHNTSSNTRR